MKYDNGMTHFHKDILAALQYMLKDDSEITEKFSPKDGSPAPLRDYLKQKYGKLRESHIGDGMHYCCNFSKGFELTFDIILNNPCDKNLTLSWSQTAKFIRDNWDEVFKKAESAAPQTETVLPKVGDYVGEDMLGDLLSFDELTEMIGQLAVDDYSTESKNWYKVVRIGKIHINAVDGSRTITVIDGTKKNDIGWIGEYAFNIEGTHTLGGKEVPRAHRMWRLKQEPAQNQPSYIDKLREKYPKINETDEWFDTVYCPSELFDGDGVNDPGDDKCDYTTKDFEACQKCWRERCPADVEFSTDPSFEEKYFKNYPAKADADENVPKEKTICDDCINNDENCVKPSEDKCIGYTSESDTILNPAQESKPTYKDVFLEHYPDFDASRFDEFINSDCRYACAAEYFTDTEPFDCNNPQSCKKCWYSPCESNWNSPDDDFAMKDISDYLKTVTVPENESPEEITDNRKMNIIYIGVNEIEPHPNNPRKDVGDVSELSEDIKENGIRQNLTVIPHEQGYRCLIGHRRLAAAKLAGLDKVPCAVENAGMSLSDQICIMLSENIQRADLTPIEQAESMQMMLDMGDTVDYISKKTGLSKSTVYRRINPIKEYGIETCKKAYEHGATFEDFSKLDEITDPKTRDKLAKTLGTSNFDYEYRNAIEDEKRNKKLNEVKELIKSYAGEISDDKKAELKYIDYISSWRAPDFKKPDDTDTVKYFYSIDDLGNVQIYREYTPDELKDREQKKAENFAFEEKRRRINERAAELKKRTDIAAELRHKFVTQFDPLKGCNSQKEQLARYKTILEFWALTYISFDFKKVDTLEYFINNIGMDVTEEFYEEETETQGKAIESHIKKSRNWELKTLFDIMISVLETYTLKYYNSYDFTYNECPALDMIYEILCSFGYEMSDEEKQLQDGSHELFTEGD